MGNSRKVPEGARHSLFDKAYKILFLIYAPIALAIYLYQFVTGAKADPLFLIAGACAAISLLLGKVAASTETPVTEQEKVPN